MKLTDLHEGRQDKVMKTIQTELWPIAKRLEKKLNNGTVATMRDRDGSVLRDSQQKAIEIVQQYTGTNSGPHIASINDATDYKEIQKILSNVLLKNMGNAVVQPGRM